MVNLHLNAFNVKMKIILLYVSSVLIRVTIGGITIRRYLLLEAVVTVEMIKNGNHKVLARIIIKNSMILK